MGGGSEDDDEDATAGMEITLSGIQLRPLTFFTGQGELMGHVWSGTASERTSALQVITFILLDVTKFNKFYMNCSLLFVGYSLASRLPSTCTSAKRIRRCDERAWICFF